jgi:hypothetical protein
LRSSLKARRRKKRKRRKGAVDILHFKKYETPNKKKNEKEVIQWEKECLSLQSERQGTGRV